MRRLNDIVAITIATISVLFYMLGCHYRTTDSGVLCLFYPLCHVNIWHLMGNLCALYSIIACGARLTPLMWLSAYALALTGVVIGMPTEGLSGLVYALLGMISMQVRDKVAYHKWIGIFILLGLAFPSTINSYLHIVCYLGGIAVGKVLDMQRRD